VLRRHLGDRGIEVMRIVREAIGNARFHLGAGEIRVDAAGSTAQVLRLDVADNGTWSERDAVLERSGGSAVRECASRRGCSERSCS
jgi:signal transduction histidine kinase